jgi:hypothetical protein
VTAEKSPDWIADWRFATSKLAMGFPPVRIAVSIYRDVFPSAQETARKRAFSSRKRKFAGTWEVNHGEEPVSFAKQFVCNCSTRRAGTRTRRPELPEDIVQGTFERYVEAFRRITGREPEL